MSFLAEKRCSAERKTYMAGSYNEKEASILDFLAKGENLSKQCRVPYFLANAVLANQLRRCLLQYMCQLCTADLRVQIAVCSTVVAIRHVFWL